jgi:hypothetical protein
VRPHPKRFLTTDYTDNTDKGEGWGGVLSEES